MGRNAGPGDHKSADIRMLPRTVKGQRITKTGVSGEIADDIREASGQLARLFYLIGFFGEDPFVSAAGFPSLPFFCSGMLLSREQEGGSWVFLSNSLLAVRPVNSITNRFDNKIGDGFLP